MENNGNRAPIIIDGANVAHSYGTQGQFEIRGILLAVSYFQRLNHELNVILQAKYRVKCEMDNDELAQILRKLRKDNLVFFIPSGAHDDNFIIQRAVKVGGFILSCDKFEEEKRKHPEWKTYVENYRLNFAFVGDDFTPNPTPLGPTGPTLKQFLSRKPRPLSDVTEFPNSAFKSNRQLLKEIIDASDKQRRTLSDYVVQNQSVGKHSRRKTKKPEAIKLELRNGFRCLINDNDDDNDDAQTADNDQVEKRASSDAVSGRQQSRDRPRSEVISDGWSLVKSRKRSQEIESRHQQQTSSRNASWRSQSDTQQQTQLQSQRRTANGEKLSTIQRQQRSPKLSPMSARKSNAVADEQQQTRSVSESTSAKDDQRSKSGSGSATQRVLLPKQRKVHPSVAESSKSTSQTDKDSVEVPVLSSIPTTNVIGVETPADAQSSSSSTVAEQPPSTSRFDSILSPSLLTSTSETPATTTTSRQLQTAQSRPKQQTMPGVVGTGWSDDGDCGTAPDDDSPPFGQLMTGFGTVVDVNSKRGLVRDHGGNLLVEFYPSACLDQDDLCCSPDVGSDLESRFPAGSAVAYVAARVFELDQQLAGAIQVSPIDALVDGLAQTEMVDACHAVLLSRSGPLHWRSANDSLLMFANAFQNGDGHCPLGTLLAPGDFLQYQTMPSPAYYLSETCPLVVSAKPLRLTGLVVQLNDERGVLRSANVHGDILFRTSSCVDTGQRQRLELGGWVSFCINKYRQHQKDRGQSVWQADKLQPVSRPNCLFEEVQEHRRKFLRRRGGSGKTSEVLLRVSGVAFAGALKRHQGVLWCPAVGRIHVDAEVLISADKSDFFPGTAVAFVAAYRPGFKNHPRKDTVWEAESVRALHPDELLRLAAVDLRPLHVRQTARVDQFETDRRWAGLHGPNTSYILYDRFDDVLNTDDGQLNPDAEVLVTYVDPPIDSPLYIAIAVEIKS